MTINTISFLGKSRPRKQMQAQAPGAKLRDKFKRQAPSLYGHLPLLGQNQILTNGGEKATQYRYREPNGEDLVETFYSKSRTTTVRHFSDGRRFTQSPTGATTTTYLNGRLVEKKKNGDIIYEEPGELTKFVTEQGLTKDFKRKSTRESLFRVYRYKKDGSIRVVDKAKDKSKLFRLNGDVIVSQGGKPLYEIPINSDVRRWANDEGTQYKEITLGNNESLRVTKELGPRVKTAQFIQNVGREENVITLLRKEYKIPGLREQKAFSVSPKIGLTPEAEKEIYEIASKAKGFVKAANKLLTIFRRI